MIIYPHILILVKKKKVSVYCVGMIGDSFCGRNVFQAIMATFQMNFVVYTLGLDTIDAYTDGTG